MSGRILVLGAAGRLGRTAAERFRDAGWQVASLVRGRAAALVVPGTETIEVDARDRGSVVEAARDADVVLHALNLPYGEWPTGAPALLDTAIAAGTLTGERFTGRWVDVGTPQRLAELDQELRDAELRNA